jgi:NADH-quinone oxidoreductase subunit L
MKLEYFIIFLPLIASIISGFFGKIIGQRNAEIVTSLFVSISATLSCIIFFNVLNYDYSNNIIILEWINSGSLITNWSIKIDPLSSLMIVVVTLISALVHIYSIGYMSNDPHRSRFMAYLSLIIFWLGRSWFMFIFFDRFLV